jgi:hypothetical protein
MDARDLAGLLDRKPAIAREDAMISARRLIRVHLQAQFSKFDMSSSEVLSDVNAGMVRDYVKRELLGPGGGIRGEDEATRWPKFLDFEGLDQETEEVGVSKFC